MKNTHIMVKNQYVHIAIINIYSLVSGTVSYSICFANGLNTPHKMWDTSLANKDNLM